VTPYVLSFGFALGCLLLGLIFGRLRPAALIAFLPMLFFIATRGLVGVDSSNYLRIFEIIRTQGLWDAGVEPGFALLVDRMASWFFHDPFDILVALGIIVAILVMIGGFLLEGKQPLLLLGMVLPFFMFDMTMNGVRYGMAFALTSIAIAYLVRKRPFVFLGIGVAAVSIQVTSLILLAAVWALLEARVRTFIATALAGVVVSFLFGEHISGRVSENVDLQITSALSGLAPLIISTIALAALAAHPDFRRSSLWQLGLLFLLQLGGFVMARYFYAGLRFQILILFMIYLYGAARTRALGISLLKSQPTVLLIILVAMAGAFLRLRNFSEDWGVGGSPFAPYYFRWEIY
jgi:hypothetical protein